ncbi:MAG: hypothetical protein JOZ49_05680 [Mycolicibacterium sp.]|nr:hypothetical protein [Mycolicibacterium sp.]
MENERAPRIWLDVPLVKNGQAKAAGAKWDRMERRWYYSGRVLPEELQPWAPRPDVPAVLPGEDRAFGAGLFVDLVPNSCWFTNVRSCVEQVDWARLRNMVCDRTEYRCELCGFRHTRGKKPQPEAHERWEYLPNYVQRLRRLICVCQPCHEMTHFGLTMTRFTRGQLSESYVNRLLAHFQAVTGLSDADGEAHIDAAFQLWESRNQYDWTLDLSMLTDAGIAVRSRY